MNRLMKRDATIQYNCVAEEITPVEVSMTLFRCEANELPPLAVARARVAFPGANVIWEALRSGHSHARWIPSCMRMPATQCFTCRTACTSSI